MDIFFLPAEACAAIVYRLEGRVDIAVDSIGIPVFFLIFLVGQSLGLGREDGDGLGEVLPYACAYARRDGCAEGSLNWPYKNVNRVLLF